MKRKVQNPIVSTLISLGVLVVGCIIGIAVGVFDGFGSLIGMVKFDLTILVQLIVMIALMIFLCNILTLILNLFKGKKGRTGTISTLLASFVRYGGILVTFCWGLSIIGVNVSTIFASVGIVALILGFGAESLVADLVTGIFILMENQYNVGDIIEVGGFRGAVQEISFRTVSLMDTGGNVKIINNSDMVDVVNLSDKQSVAVCEVGVSYDTDLEELEEKFPEIFDAIKEKYKDVFVGEIKYLGVEELADSCIRLKIKADVNEKDIFGARRLLNKELKIAFDKEKIVIPYPQLDVHTK